MRFSEKLSSAREREEATYMHFLTYFQNCEKSKLFHYTSSIFLTEWTSMYGKYEETDQTLNEKAFPTFALLV